jgi:signal transduction histidine kinase/ligand-binding sensor domain-containing protein/DNA-binding response OmpR family regulator
MKINLFRLRRILLRSDLLYENVYKIAIFILNGTTPDSTSMTENNRTGKTGIFRAFVSLTLFLSYFITHSLAQGLGKVTRYSIREGLSYGVVNSIAQGKEGFLWFATGDGLNRFDGHNFKVYKHNPEDTNSIAGNYVRAVMADSEGTLWVSSRSGFSEFSTSKEHFTRHLPSSQKRGVSDDVSDISPAKNGDLWISLNGSGFAAFNKKTKKFRFYDLKNVTGLNTNSILDVFEDSKGLLWLGTRDTGIEIFDIDARRNLKKSGIDISMLPKARINRIYEDHFHNIWVASARGLFLFRRDEGKFYKIRINTFHKSDIYLSLLENKAGLLIIGVQDGGVYSLDLNKFHSKPVSEYEFNLVKNTQNEGITQRSVQTIYLDKDQNIWLGTYGDGVYLIGSISEKFRLFQKRIADSRAESYLRYYGMCTDREGNLWLGTDGDGIYKTTSSGQLLRHYAVDGKPGSLTDGAIIAAHRDRQNNLWFGSYSKGLFLYNSKSDSFTSYSSNPRQSGSLPVNDVRVIYEDKNNRLWVGTNGGGLCLLDRETGQFKQFIPGNSSVNSNDVRAIVEDKKGNLWIGTYGGGLNYLNTQTMRFTQFFNNSRQGFLISNRIIFSLYLDNKDRLFIGTEGNGLVLFDIPQKKVELYAEKNGLANNVINAIHPENENRVWISTNKGLSLIDLAAKRVENFDHSDGLQAGQFNPNSVLSGQDSSFLAFGGTEGWNIFDPATIHQSSYKPPVLITGLQLFGKEVEVGSKQNGRIILPEQIGSHSGIILQPDESVFSIQYTALNYAYPEKGQFAYMLDGLDNDWNYVQNERTATYRYLSPGHYTFRVKAANQDGVWSEEQATLSIRILPPWYKTWWAILLYLSVTALLIYYYQKYKKRQSALQYRVRVAQLESRKDKELNDRKIAYFTNISHEFRTPLTLIINPAKELLSKQENDNHASLNIIYRNAKRLLSLVDQLLLFRKADQKQNELNLAFHDLQTLLSEVFSYFLHQAEQKNLRYELIGPEEPIEITADSEKLEIALFNLISNAIKFTPDNGTVLVRLMSQHELVQISVEDSGIGIPPEAGDRIFSVFDQYPDKRALSKGGFGIGLYLAKTFVENHFGTLTYQARQPEGTIFTILLPKSHPDLKTSDTDKNRVRRSSVFLEELLLPDAESEDNASTTTFVKPVREELNAGVETMLLIDDDAEMRSYLAGIFGKQYKLLQATSAEAGLEMVRKHAPDIVLSDVMMGGMSGIELCEQMKKDLSVNHIPVVLLTASSSQESRLRGIEGGADDYISKPFDKDLLVARVTSILKGRNDLQRYFYNEITLQSGDSKISPEYKEFLEKCISIVEQHITNSEFNIKMLASEIGMSHSTLYNRIKSISGQSTNSFIRFIRLRRAAEILISSDTTILETSEQVGINDVKYFREQFTALFGMKPSEYIKKYRKPFHERHPLNKDIFKSK